MEFCKEDKRKENLMIQKLNYNRRRNDWITTGVVDNYVVKSKLQKMEIQNLYHLGILAGIIDPIGVVEIILEIGKKVSPGHVVKAMIINGLGFV